MAARGRCDVAINAATGNGQRWTGREGGSMTDLSTYTRHPVSTAFGDMDENEFAALKDSIKKDGLLDTVVYHQNGQIVDGWHRVRAVRELGDDYKGYGISLKELATDANLFSLVIGKNGARRHKTASQRAGAVAFLMECLKLDSAEYSYRKLAGMAGVNHQTMADALKAEDKGYGEQVRSGAMAASAAVKEIRRKEMQAEHEEKRTEWKKSRRLKEAAEQEAKEAAEQEAKDTTEQEQGLPPPTTTTTERQETTEQETEVSSKSEGTEPPTPTAQETTARRVPKRKTKPA